MKIEMYVHVVGKRDCKTHGDRDNTATIHQYMHLCDKNVISFSPFLSHSQNLIPHKLTSLMVPSYVCISPGKKKEKEKVM